MAELLRQRLTAVGIHLSIRSLDGKSRDARVHGGAYQLAILGHGGWGGDPDYLAVCFAEGAAPDAAPSNSGLPRFLHPDLSARLTRQQIEIDPGRRQVLIIEVQKLLAELVPEIPLFYATDYCVYRPARYDGWMFMFDHHSLPHSKLSYLARSGPAVLR